MIPKTIFHRALLQVLALLWLGSAAVHGEQGLSKKTRDLFEWYDRLGFDDVSQMSFVEVFTGETVRAANGKTRGEWREGFLNSRGAEGFTVLHLDLRKRNYPVRDEDRPATPYKYRVVSFEKRAREVLRQMRDPDYFRKWDEERAYGRSEELRRCDQIFVMARECAERGMSSLAEQLVEALARPYGNDPSHTFVAELRSQIATVACHRAWRALHHESKSWKEIAEGFRRFVEHCPESENAETAGEILVKVERMVAEEAEHARTAPKSLEGLPAPEKARELVWRLRDVPGLPGGIPGLGPPPARSAVEDALCKMGMEAVPALLAELRDPGRLSRYTIEPPENNSMSYTMTQELAGGVLDEIVGFSFDEFVDESEPDARWPKVAKVAEEWWKSRESGREQDWLVDRVKRGGTPAAACAERLHELFPNAFAAAALEGLAAARMDGNSRARAELLRLLRLHREPKVEEALAGLFKESGSTERVAVARLLREWENPAGDEAMREQWRRAVAAGLAPTGQFRARNAPFLMGQFVDLLSQVPDGVVTGYISPEAFDSVVALQFLTESDSPENLRVVLESWPKLPIEYRHFIVEFVMRFAQNGGFRPEILTSATHRAFCQELLLAALEDATEPPDWKAQYFDGFMVYPRLCDVAGRGLHARWPARYAFDFLATRPVREIQRVKILNAEHRELGRPELPPPSSRTKVPPAEANHVVTVEWDVKSARPDEPMARQVAVWKDQPLPVEAVVSALAGYAKNPQAGTVRFRVAVFRDGDSTGVVMRLCLDAGETAKPVNVRVQQMVVLGRSLLTDQDLTGDLAGQFGEQAWANLKNNMAMVLRSPVNSPFIVVAEVSPGE